MRSFRSRRAGFVALAALIGAPTLGGASATRPEPGHTGGFGEPTCRACHFDNAQDDPRGALRLEGVPATARPGATYRLSVVLERAGLSRGGFQLAARFAAGPTRARSVGILLPVDGTVEITRLAENGVDYAHHTPQGTRNAEPGALRWELDWTAPAESGPIHFHLAANATNDDDSEFGDFVYAAEAASDVIGAPALAARGQLAETILHEATYGLDIASQGKGSAFATLRALLEARGVGPRDRRYHDIPHTLMFVQAAETMRRIYDAAHVSYGESSGLYARTGTIADVERRIWPQYFDGQLDRDEALRRIVDELVPAPATEPASPE